MEGTQVSVGFTWSFLQEMASWTLAAGIAIAVIGGILLKNLGFSATLIAGVLADVAIVETVARRRGGDEADHNLRSQNAALFVLGRLIIKAAVLVLAFLSPSREVFWGAVIGVVLFDTVLLSVGSVRAASATFGASGR